MNNLKDEIHCAEDERGWQISGRVEYGEGSRRLLRGGYVVNSGGTIR